MDELDDSAFTDDEAAGWIEDQLELPPEDDCESPFDIPNDPDPLRERS